MLGFSHKNERPPIFEEKSPGDKVKIRISQALEDSLQASSPRVPGRLHSAPGELTRSLNSVLHLSEAWLGDQRHESC